MNALTIKIGSHFTVAGFSAKALKTFRGREGGGFSFSLYYCDNRVAHVFDDASGAPVGIQWIPGHETASKALATVVGSIPAQDGLAVSEDWALTDFFTYCEIKRDCRKRTMFLVNDQLMEIKRPLTDDLRAHVASKYPTALLVNDVFDSPLDHDFKPVATEPEAAPEAAPEFIEAEQAVVVSYKTPAGEARETTVGLTDALATAKALRESGDANWRTIRYARNGEAISAPALRALLK